MKTTVEQLLKTARRLRLWADFLRDSDSQLATVLERVMLREAGELERTAKEAETKSLRGAA